MPALEIVQKLHEESGRIERDIYTRNFATDPWTHLAQYGEFPEEMGQILSVLTFERTAPTTANPAWSDVSIVDGAVGGTCLPPVYDVDVASTLRTYNLQHIALEGPRFCANDIRFKINPRDQLAAIIGTLADNTRIYKALRRKHEYLRLVKRKVVVQSNDIVETNTGAETFPAQEATGILTQGVLDKYKLKVIRDGAAQSAMGKEDGSPVLTLMISAEASDSLLKANAEAREDLRYGEPNELLKQIGVRRSYKGFFHVVDNYPMRFSYSGGTYTEVPVFAESAATKGNKADINSDWENPAVATHEACFIYDPMVLQCLVPKPVIAPYKDFKFNPATFNGQWKLMNILHETNNPDGTIVYHRGLLADASKPVHPERGVAIIYKRCDPPPALTGTCPTS